MLNIENSIMEKPITKSTDDNDFVISAIQQEIYTRILPSIRHDLVTYLSASLMRVSIMNRQLSNESVDSNQLKTELLKIESLIKSSITEIRELKVWDFQSLQDDYPSEIWKKSIKLMSIELAMQNIHLIVIPPEFKDIKKVETKPLTYCLLSLLSYIEDNDYENNNLKFHHYGKSIVIEFEPLTIQNTIGFEKARNLKISKQLVLDITKFYNMNIYFSMKEIKLVWN